jgi:hypothetical protein
MKKKGSDDLKSQPKKKQKKKTQNPFSWETNKNLNRDKTTKSKHQQKGKR